MTELQRFQALMGQTPRIICPKSLFFCPYFNFYLTPQKPQSPCNYYIITYYIIYYYPDYGAGTHENIHLV